MQATADRFKRAAARWLDRAGYRLERSERPRAECFERLARMKHLGFAPKLVFDCGAFVGDWTWRCLEIFPDTRAVLVEPNPEVLPRVRATAAALGSRVELVEAAVGETRGPGLLHVWAGAEDPVGSQASSLLGNVRGPAAREHAVEIRTLAELATCVGVAPDLVKLDLQGAELAALRGAGELLGETELFVVEFGCLDAYESRTTPRELLDVFDDAGYALHDIVDLGYRPHDGALCSGDFFFLRRSSPLRAHAGYA